MLSIFFFNITSSAWLSINTFKHFGIAVATIAFIRFLALYVSGAQPARTVIELLLVHI